MLSNWNLKSHKTILIWYKSNNCILRTDGPLGAPCDPSLYGRIDCYDSCPLCSPHHSCDFSSCYDDIFFTRYTSHYGSYISWRKFAIFFISIILSLIIQDFLLNIWVTIYVLTRDLYITVESQMEECLVTTWWAISWSLTNHSNSFV